jgi:proline dehydrogenase
MEDSPWIETTLSLFRRMKFDCGCDNVGIVIQSYLYRSEEDVAQIMKMNGRVRLCKGAYQEPEKVAFPKKKDVDANYDHLTNMLVDGALSAGSPSVSEDGKIPPIPAIATHDESCIEHAKTYIEAAGLPREAMEFQMLNGIRRDLQIQLASDGYPVRVYVPYGTEWYPYFTRRLAERPANLWFFISNLFRS